jgi:hypothetical protein
VAVWGSSENLGLGDREFGFFSDSPITRWLSQGRNMQLLNKPYFTDPDGKVWPTFVGDIIDGATIPKAAWTVYGGPFEGIYRDASVYHDHVCNYYTSIEERRLGDRMFWAACRCCGCDKEQADFLYNCVKAGTLVAQLEGRTHGDKVGLIDVPDRVGNWH